MRLFLDECLSPRVANELMAEDGYYVVHPRNQGGLGEGDHTVLARCVADDLIIVTENARDFRALAARADVHPGMIILPCLDRFAAKNLLKEAITYLRTLGDPSDIMVNKVLEVEVDGTFELYNLPED
jgi:predicted nuclease of predicted toxin-antitoxin system